MSLACDITRRLKPDFNEDYGKIVIGIARPMDDAVKTKQALFNQAEMLLLVLALASKNGIFLGDEVLEVVGAILRGMEKHLDGETSPIALNAAELEWLGTFYQGISRHMGEIMICQADERNRQARRCGK